MTVARPNESGNWYTPSWIPGRGLGVPIHMLEARYHDDNLWSILYFIAETRRTPCPMGIWTVSTVSVT